MHITQAAGEFLVGAAFVEPPVLMAATQRLAHGVHTDALVERGHHLLAGGGRVYQRLQYFTGGNQALTEPAAVG